MSDVCSVIYAGQVLIVVQEYRTHWGVFPETFGGALRPGLPVGLSLHGDSCAGFYRAASGADTVRSVAVVARNA